MTESDRRALARLAGGDASPRATADDLQSLLLQVSLALLMVFMIACFIFRQESNREREQAVMAVNRQKLTLALDQVAEDHRIRYGLNALMTQGTDGRRTFDAAGFVRDGALEFAPAARQAFAQGGRFAAGDFADSAALAAGWRTNVFEAAGLSESALSGEERAWFDGALAADVEAVRLDVRGVQRGLAAQLQRVWTADPGRVPGYAELSDNGDYAAFAGEVAELLRVESLRRVSEAMDGGEVLP